MNIHPSIACAGKSSNSIDITLHLRSQYSFPWIGAVVAIEAIHPEKRNGRVRNIKSDGVFILESNPQWGSCFMIFRLPVDPNLNTLGISIMPAIFGDAS